MSAILCKHRGTGQRKPSTTTGCDGLHFGDWWISRTTTARNAPLSLTADNRGGRGVWQGLELR